MEWGLIAKARGIRPEDKCVHGMYLAEHYCEVCRFEPIDPGYDPGKFRTEISKVLAQSRMGTLNGEEGRKDLKDIQQIIDIEIWKAARSYGAGAERLQLDD